MKKKKYLSPRDESFTKLAEAYEEARSGQKSFYAESDELAGLAEWYANRHNDELALEVVNYGLSLYPHDVSLTVEKAYLYFDNRDYDKAWQVCRSLVEVTDEVRLLQANLLMAEGKVDQAEVLLESLDEPEFMPNVVDTAYVYADGGMPQKAVEIMSRWVDYYREDDWFMACYAEMLGDNNELEEAMNIYDQLLFTNPYQPECWFNLARCQYLLHEEEKALDSLEFALVSNPEYVDALILKGNCYMSLENPDAAIVAYKQALEVNSDAASIVHSHIGVLLLEKQQWEEALEHLEIAVQEPVCDESFSASLYGATAYCCFKLHRMQEAVSFLERADKLCPDSFDVLLTYARMYAETGQAERAVTYFRRAAEVSPVIDSYNLICRYAIDNYLFSFAEEMCALVIEADPHFPGIHERMSTLKVINRDLEGFKRENALCLYPLPDVEVETIEKLIAQGLDNEDIAQRIALIMRKYYDDSEQ